MNVLEKYLSIILSTFSFSIMLVLTIKFFTMGLVPLGIIVGAITFGLTFFIFYDYKKLKGD